MPLFFKTKAGIFFPSLLSKESGTGYLAKQVITGELSFRTLWGKQH
jgi:hypothetical protein